VKVRIYRNLHRSCWSVVDVKTGRVIAHRPAVTLTQAEFIVRPAGRAKVLKEHKKNVHAFVVGNLVYNNGDDMQRNGPLGVTYNPYKYETFVVRQTEQPIKNAPRVRLDSDGKVWVG
jgi:hypothetical protein